MGQIMPAVTCPSCRTLVERRGDVSVCLGCSARYPITYDVIDLRDAKFDESDRFSIANDMLIATGLAASYDQATDFHQLCMVYEALWHQLRSQGEIATLDLKALLSAIRPRAVSRVRLAREQSNYEHIERLRRGRGRLLPSRNLALESGIGRSLFISALAAQFESLVAVDISLSRLLLGRKLADELKLSNIIFLCGNVERLPLASDSVDFVHSSGLIEHIDDQPAMVREAHRVLRHGGVLYVESPNRLTLGIEQHSGVRCAGLLPKPFRRLAARGRSARAATIPKLLSLGELRDLMTPLFEQHFHVDSRMQYNVCIPSGRSFGQILFSLPMAKRLARFRYELFSRLLLRFTPHHLALCVKAGSAKLTNDTRQSQGKEGERSWLRRRRGGVRSRGPDASTGSSSRRSVRPPSAGATL